MNGLPIFSAASQANELRVEPSGCREGHVRVGGASGTRWRHCRALRRASPFTWTYGFSRTQTSVLLANGRCWCKAVVSLVVRIALSLSMEGSEIDALNSSLVLGAAVARKEVKGF